MLVFVNEAQNFLHFSQTNSTRIRIVGEKEMRIYHQHVALLLLLALPPAFLVLHPDPTQQTHAIPTIQEKDGP